MKHNILNPSQTFGLYSERILELCNHVFSRMYRRVFKQYWHDNRFYARMPRNYCNTNWKEGTYEIYIPIREHVTQNLTYYRIAIKVVTELDPWIAREESVQLMKAIGRSPPGILDSELLVVVAPKRKGRGFVRGFRHLNKRGYLTATIISNIPEIAFKRLLTIIRNFLEKRIDKLLEKLDFKPWQYDYYKKEQFYYRYLFSIIERYSHSIATTLRCLSHSLAWVVRGLKFVLKEIGRQNMIKMAVKTYAQLKKLLFAISESPLHCKQQDPPILKKLLTVFNIEGSRLKAG